VTDGIGHDRRSAIDSSFAQQELKWKPLRNFRQGVELTME
jgi:dTDP-D-glucose 4,6-dehydratase